MFISLKILVLVVCALSANAQRRYGSNCRNVNCPSSQQCLGLYEPCKGDLVDGSTCGFYASCVGLDDVDDKHSERPASTSNANEPKPIQRGSSAVSSDTPNNNGQLYPSLPQPDYPSSPQGGYYPPPNQQGGYYPPPNQQGGYYPPNPQGPSNYPAGPDSTKNKKDSSSDSGFGSTLLNFFSGGNNRGSAGNSGSSGGPDLGSLLSILGKGTSGNSASSSGSGGLDFSSLLSSFTGTKGSGSGSSQNTRNDYDNRNPTGQVNPNQAHGVSNGQNPNQAEDTGPSFLQTLGNFASSPLGQQLIVNALRNRNNENDAQQNRRF